MAHGGPAADPQVSADLSTIRVWHRRILAGKLEWPLPARMWDNALKPGRGRGPTRNLKQLAVRLGWFREAWLVSEYQVLCAEVAGAKPDFEGLAAGLSTSAYRRLKLDGQSQNS
eukprot:535336-Amphidinium_carterae.1